MNHQKTITIPGHLVDALEQAARQENRTTKSWIENVVNAALQEIQTRPGNLYDDHLKNKDDVMTGEKPSRLQQAARELNIVLGLQEPPIDLLGTRAELKHGIREAVSLIIEGDEFSIPTARVLKRIFGVKVRRGEYHGIDDDGTPRDEITDDDEGEPEIKEKPAFKRTKFKQDIDTHLDVDNSIGDVKSDELTPAQQEYLDEIYDKNGHIKIPYTPWSEMSDEDKRALRGRG